MKNLLLSLFSCAFAISTLAQSHLQVSGNDLVGTCGDNIILRGINYPVFNWGWTASEDYFPEIEKTGANCVRISWYQNNAAPLYANLAYLDSALARCVRAKMIPIVELHDATCSGNMADVTNLLPFYTSANFKVLEQKYRKHLIINIANEAGYYGWTGNPAAALATYQSVYSNAITTLRSNGIEVPIMIDAPDCGTNSDAFVNGAAAILNADPLNNTMFSVHAYWWSFTGNNAANMTAKVNALVNTGLCVVFGEIANYQSDQSACQYLLDYQTLMGILQSNQIGWLAWAWTGDWCSQREMTNNGSFNNLTPYGNQVVNNASWGLAAHAVRATQLVNPPCSILGFEEEQANFVEEKTFSIYPNPSKDIVNIETESPVERLLLFAPDGKIVQSWVGDIRNISVHNLAAGIYTLQIQIAEDTHHKKLVVQGK